MRTKQFFILSMRRSGSSFTREVLLKHPEIGNIEFEPYLLWMAARLQEIGRYRKNEYLKKLLNDFNNPCNKWKGIKWVGNPGIEFMYWKVLPKIFPEAKFIFIERDAIASYKSWIDQDINSTRGIVNYEMYKPWRDHIVNSFKEFCDENPKKAVILQYENILSNIDDEFKKVWKLLDIEPINNLSKFIKKPKYNE